MKVRSVITLIVVSVVLSGCAVVAAPCRVAGAVAKVVPIIGNPVGATLDACGDVID